VIRLATLDHLDNELLDWLRKTIFQSFGLGCELAGEVPIPKKAIENQIIDARALLKNVLDVESFADDKILYLTSLPLAVRNLPSGEVPTFGLSTYGGKRAVVSIHGLPPGDILFKRAGKQALHEVGHLWKLHHCLDHRCAMHPPWTASFAQGDPILCSFCREKSEFSLSLTT
jgi:predicted Zn-dependent protease